MSEKNEIINGFDAQQVILREISDIKTEIDEIRKLIRQSQLEVDDVAKQNEKVNMELQQIISREKSESNQELVNKFNDALRYQQRLILMRGQHEKLSSQQDQLIRFQAVLDKVKEGIAKNQAEMIEEKAESVVSAGLLIQAQEVERQRLSRQIHDGPAQSLSNFIMQAEIASHLMNKDPEKAQLELENLKKSAAKTFQQVRDFIFMLRPMMLDDLGLVPTIKKYGELYAEKMNVDISISVTGTETRYENYIEVMVFRSAQLFLENAIADGKANQAKIQMDLSESQIRMIVDDNRSIIEPEEVTQDINQKITTVSDKVNMMGGSINTSAIPGEGVNIMMNLPVFFEES